MKQRARSITWALAVGFGLASIGLGAAPPAPNVTSPPAGAVLGSNRPDLTWSAAANDGYEVHIGSFNIPSSANGWSSGQVIAGQPVSGATSGPLTAQQTYFVFVRLHNADGWGDWSPPNQSFSVIGELLNDPYKVADPVGGQWQHTLCFNPDRNEYLIAYFDNSKGKDSVVSYYRLNAQGQRIGNEAWVIDDLAGIRNPSVCYNSVHHEYLIKYAGYTASDNQVRIQRIDAATGALIGGSNLIHSGFILDLYSIGMNVAYSSKTDCYLIAWEVYDQGDIYAAKLDATGLPIGTPFRIDAVQSQYSRKQVICFNSVNDEFMIVFQGVITAEDDWDVFTQRVRASDGAMLGSNLTISGTTDIEQEPGIAYDSDLNRYLVIFAGGSPSPSGQLVSGAGTLVGPRFRIAPDPYYDGAMCGIAWNPVTKEYLAAWAHNNSYGNFVRRVGQNGVGIGEPIRINADVLGIGNWYPRPVANSVNNEFLISWFNSYDDVYVRRYKTYPPPPPDTTAPAPVTGLTVTRFAADVKLTWKNPSNNDFSGARIRFKTTGFPADPTDGELLADQANAPSTTDSFTHPGLAKGTYYYAVFAHDPVPNYAAATLGRITIQPADFDGDGDVDQSDFSHLQLCFSGEGHPYANGCADADLDANGDVSINDLNMFLDCMGGPQQPPGC